MAVMLVAMVAVPAGAQHPPWMTTGSLAIARHAHTATSLADGRVLVTGGVASSGEGGLGSTVTAEVYDPATGTWSPTGSMAVGRNEHTATLLADGTVLVTGGIGEGSAELYQSELVDPRTGVKGMWTPTVPMAHARNLHTATLLDDGRVLVVGGDLYFTPMPTAEIYDPATRSWSPTAPLGTRRVSHTATRLADGTVLVAGGQTEADPRYSVTHDLASVEIYDATAVDPGTGLPGRWEEGSPLETARSNHTATMLSTGKLLVTGGKDGETSAELYDPETSPSEPTGALAHARRFHTATLLANDQVLVVGGEIDYQVRRTAEVYDPESGTWELVDSLHDPRVRHTATPLPDGTVLVAAGGFDSAELFQDGHNPTTTTTTVDVGCPAIGPPGEGQVVYSSGWALVGLPEGTRVPADSKLYAWFDRNDDGDYSTQEPSDPVRGGHGYWARFACPRLVDVGPGTTTTAFPLGASRASMVGNPSGNQSVRVSGHDFAAQWDPSLDGGAGGYRYSDYRQSITLAPGEGAWVFSFVSTEIRMQP